MYVTQQMPDIGKSAHMYAQIAKSQEKNKEIFSKRAANYSMSSYINDKLKTTNRTYHNSSDQNSSTMIFSKKKSIQRKSPPSSQFNQMYYNFGKDIDDINIEYVNPNLESSLAYTRRPAKDKAVSFRTNGRENINVHLSKQIDRYRRSYN